MTVGMLANRSIPRSVVIPELSTASRTSPDTCGPFPSLSRMWIPGNGVENQDSCKTPSEMLAGGNARNSIFF